MKVHPVVGVVVLAFVVQVASDPQQCGRERTAVCATITYVVLNGAIVDPPTPIAAKDVRAARVHCLLRRLNAGQERTALSATITYVVVNGAIVDPPTPIAATDVRAARVQRRLVRRLRRLLRLRVDWEKY
jgi:prophage maintenance system killer protein